MNGSVVTPSKQSLLLPMVVSVVGHGLGLGLAVLFTVVGSRCAPKKNIIDLERTMEVAMVLPRARTKMPDRAQRAPVPKGSPEPQPDHVKPPPKQSDLTIHKEDAVADAGMDAERQAMMDQLERQRLLDELLAPTGPVDRNATDPDSTSDAQISAVRAGAHGDPEFAAYIAKLVSLFNNNFKPLGAITQGKPNLLCKVMVQVDTGSGRVITWEITQSSGIPAYDAAAERAVQLVGSVPMPPARFQALMAEGYEIQFTPP